MTQIHKQKHNNDLLHKRRCIDFFIHIDIDIYIDIDIDIKKYPKFETTVGFF